MCYEDDTSDSPRRSCGISGPVLLARIPPSRAFGYGKVGPEPERFDLDSQRNYQTESAFT